MATPALDDQSAFLRSLASGTGGFRDLFDHLPGVLFFAKDCGCRIMCTNLAFRERFGFRDESEIIGKSDFDLFPKPLADKFRADDHAVMESAQPMDHIVELFLNRQGIPDWFVTNKLPLFRADGTVAGVMGTVQRYDSGRLPVQPHPEIDRAVRYIREHYREKIAIADLARRVGLSPRQFDRKFKETFGITPQNYVMKTRVQAACDALRAPRSTISDVAHELGFYDQSAFTAQFRNHMGITPSRYQRQFRL
ncbi:AraC family transcriptional regulator [soil metagenome]